MIITIALKKILHKILYVINKFLSIAYRFLPLLTLLALFFSLVFIGQITGFLPIAISSGTSMLPNFPAEKAVNIYAGWMEPDYYDVIAFTIPEDDERFAIPNVIYAHAFETRNMKKRVIALPGDDVLISGDEIYVNGELIDISYFGDTYEGWNTKNIERTYEDIDGYFVLGDNRKNSFDSFYLGPIPADLIDGTLIAFFKLPGFLQ